MLDYHRMESDPELVTTSIGEMSLALSGAEPEEITEFLYSLFTPAEADEIAKRWALVKALAQGTPQRQIAQNLGLSLCKITRGSRELKKEHSAFRLMLLRAGVPLGAETSARRRKMKTSQAPAGEVSRQRDRAEPEGIAKRP